MVGNELNSEQDIREGRRWPDTIEGLRLARESIRQTLRLVKTSAVKRAFQAQIAEIDEHLEALGGR